MMPKAIIEVCVEGVDGLLAAQAAGADRVELCASLMEGGLTPSLGTIREALRQTTVPFHVMIRPRGGDFVYSDTEYRAMLDDIITCRGMGVPGVVIGCLLPAGTVDSARTLELVAAARPMSVTFHRAFDMTRDPLEAVDALVACGIDRVLTSGQRATALEGLPILRALQERAAGRIIVLGCGALTPHTIAQVRAATQLGELHFAALHDRASPMEYRNTHIGMGSSGHDREYILTVTDPALVGETIRAARALEQHAPQHP